jgi:hypothetical protein
MSRGKLPPSWRQVLWAALKRRPRSRYRFIDENFVRLALARQTSGRFDALSALAGVDLARIRKNGVFLLVFAEVFLVPRTIGVLGKLDQVAAASPGARTGIVDAPDLNELAVAIELLSRGAHARAIAGPKHGRRQHFIDTAFDGIIVFGINFELYAVARLDRVDKPTCADRNKLLVGSPRSRFLAPHDFLRYRLFDFLFRFSFFTGVFLTLAALRAGVFLLCFTFFVADFFTFAFCFLLPADSFFADLRAPRFKAFAISLSPKALHLIFQLTSPYGWSIQL